MDSIRLEVEIDDNFFNVINPPENYYPPSQQYLIQKIEAYFIQECQRFLLKEKQIYSCTKNIQKKLTNLKQHYKYFEKEMQKKQEIIHKVYLELNKLTTMQSKLQQRQHYLSMFCDLIELQKTKEKLLLKNTIERQQQQDYLKNLQELYLALKSLQEIQLNEQQLPLLKDIKKELKNIYNESINLIFKKYLSLTMIKLIMQKYYNIFNYKQKQFNQMIQNYYLQKIKITLYPMINNLNYVRNISQLYCKIIFIWKNIIMEEKLLFQSCGKIHLFQKIIVQIVKEFIPKMEKNTYKINRIEQIACIRKNITEFYTFLIEWQNQKWQPLPNLINKLQILLQTMLQQQSQELQKSKYNIYSLTSYIPIRQHLEIIKICKQNSIINQIIDWDIYFEKISSSRQPENQPNNKSLILFNLNIWYLYNNIIFNGRLIQKGKKKIQFCQQILFKINIENIKRYYQQTFEKVLELCGNIIHFKNILYAELSLLGHQQLRYQIAQNLKQQFIHNIYPKMLKSIGKQQMNNKQIKQYCHLKKINLNKFGKYSHCICIYSSIELKQKLKYY